MIGQKLGHYKILDLLGAGGMGEVYRAEDTTLEREVALKILPPELAENQERLDRFQREAKTLAALDHPNIVHIYTVEEEDGIHFLTMQLVEGKPLSHLIPSSGMPLERIFDIAIPLADALATAHEKGVIHRDLKPANVMVTDEGRVKVLDFGLAKLRQGAHAAVATQLPTEPLTQEGLILGTMPYMSPEQVEGKNLDVRSDIFSLGVMLYEIATGQRPFHGDTSASLIMSIGRDVPPEVDTVREELPHHLGRVFAHCLEKNPKRRYQSALDVQNELDALRKELDSGVVRPSIAEGTRKELPRDRRWWHLAGGVSGLLLLILGGLALWPRLAPSRPEVDVPLTSEEALNNRKMIVVLPFENLGPPEDAYFADGMTEEITSRLAAVSGLGVISRTSAVQYDRTGKTLKKLGADLGVDFVLEGTVRWGRSAEGPSRVLVTPQLIRVLDDTHMWSDRFDRELEDIFAVQAQIAQRVIDLLAVTLLEPERERLETRPTDNMEAYQAYLHGMANAGRSGGGVDQDWELAEVMFERAVKLDPEFALAHARLSWARSNRIWFGGGEKDWSASRQAATRALELQPDLPEAQYALGLIYYWSDFDYDRALELFGKAADGRPSDSEIVTGIAAIHRRQGNLELALVFSQLAATLDPRSSGVSWELALTLRSLRRYQEADAEYARSILLGPDQRSAYLDRSDNRIHWTGNLQEARTMLEEAPPATLGPYSHWTWYAQLWLERNYEELLQNIADSGEFHCMGCSSLYRRLYQGAAYLALGDAERSRAAYEKALVKLQKAVNEYPEVAGVRARLGEAHAGLGQKDAAIREGQMAVELLPTSEDALRGPVQEEALAHIYVMVDEDSAALDLLERLLSIPAPISVNWLRLDPTWDPLRDHPRFQALLENHGQGDS